MSKLHNNGFSDSQADEAAEWLARLSADDIDVEECKSFRRWLDKTPSNRQAFDCVQSISGKLDSLATARMADSANVPVELDAIITESEPLARKARRHNEKYRRIFAAAASVLIGISAALFWQAQERTATIPEPKLYRTITGQQREVLLPDGSMMILNTATEVAVAITDSQRRIHLKNGEAFFDVAKDPQRTFIVAVGNGTVRALGTAFNVHHRNKQTEVTITAGRIEINPDIARQTGNDGEPMSAQQFSAGQKIIFDGGFKKITQLSSQDMLRVTAWQDGKLVFHRQSLEAIVGELQHYMTKEIVIADESVGALVGGGVFDVRNANSILAAIEHSMPVRVLLRGDVVFLIRKPN